MDRRIVNAVFFNAFGLWVTEEELALETGLPADANLAGMKQQIVDTQTALPDGWQEGSWTILLNVDESVDDVFPIVFPPGAFKGLRREDKYPISEIRDGYGVTPDDSAGEPNFSPETIPYLDAVIPTLMGRNLLLKFRGLPLQFLDLESFLVVEFGVSANILTAVQNAEADHGDLVIFPFTFPAKSILAYSEKASVENVDYFNQKMAEQAAIAGDLYIEAVVPFDDNDGLLIKFRGKPLQYLAKDDLPGDLILFHQGYAEAGKLIIPTMDSSIKFPPEYIWECCEEAGSESVTYFNRHMPEQNMHKYAQREQDIPTKTVSQERSCSCGGGCGRLVTKYPSDSSDWVDEPMEEI